MNCALTHHEEATLRSVVHEALRDEGSHSIADGIGFASILSVLAELHISNAVAMQAITEHFASLGDTQLPVALDGATVATPASRSPATPRRHQPLVDSPSRARGTATGRRDVVTGSPKPPPLHSDDIMPSPRDAVVSLSPPPRASVWSSPPAFLSYHTIVSIVQRCKGLTSTHREEPAPGPATQSTASGVTAGELLQAPAMALFSPLGRWPSRASDDTAIASSDGAIGGEVEDDTERLSAEFVALGAHRRPARASTHSSTSGNDEVAAGSDDKDERVLPLTILFARVPGAHRYVERVGVLPGDDCIDETSYVMLRHAMMDRPGDAAARGSGLRGRRALLGASGSSMWSAVEPSRPTELHSSSVAQVAPTAPSRLALAYQPSGSLKHYTQSSATFAKTQLTQDMVSSPTFLSERSASFGDFDGDSQPVGADALRARLDSITARKAETTPKGLSPIVAEAQRIVSWHPPPRKSKGTSPRRSDRSASSTDVRSHESRRIGGSQRSNRAQKQGRGRTPPRSARQTYAGQRKAVRTESEPREGRAPRYMQFATMHGTCNYRTIVNLWKKELKPPSDKVVPVPSRTITEQVVDTAAVACDGANVGPAVGGGAHPVMTPRQRSVLLAAARRVGRQLITEAEDQAHPASRGAGSAIDHNRKKWLRARPRPLAPTRATYHPRLDAASSKH